MNWYEHHIGDYDKNTSHLTACEDGIYSRLLRRYYDKEKPLPVEIVEVQRLARARNKEEKRAVVDVLNEFFFCKDDGWHHKVCDDVIAIYRAGEPEREAKKLNEETRLTRHRAERAELFRALNAGGQHLPWNTAMGELRAAVAALQNASASTPPATAPETPTATPPATGTATPATATHPPLPTHHSLIPEDISARSSVADDPPGPEDEPERRAVSREAAACLAMKAEGIGDVNPGHPDLARLLSDGAGLEAFVGAAKAAVGRHKGFAYALGIVSGQLAETKVAAENARTTAPAARKNGHSGGAARAARMAEAVPNLVAPARTPGDNTDTEARNVAPRRLG